MFDLPLSPKIFKVILREPVLYDEKLSCNVYIKADTYSLDHSWVVFYTDNGSKSVATFNRDMVIMITD